MAIEYSLELDTNLTPAGVIALLSRRPSLASTESGRLYGSGLSIGCIDLTKIGESRNELGQTASEEAWGICPTVAVRYRCIALPDDTPEDSSPQQEEVVGSSIALMTHLQSDAVLLFNDEITIMLYRGGKLTLNGDFMGFWTPPGRLAWVTMPYTIESVPSLL
jgi:hypothetical protein